MIDRLRQPWGFSRVLRLAVGLAFLWAAIAEGEAIAWFAAAFFGGQAILNMGCCGPSCNASTTPNRNKAAVVEEVHYEEVH